MQVPDIQTTTLRGYLFWSKLSRLDWHPDYPANKYYTTNLRLTHDDGTPVVAKNKRTGEETDFQARAKELNIPTFVSDGEEMIRVRRKEKSKAGKMNGPIEVKDRMDNPIDPDTIGNGTLADVNLSVIPYPKKEKIKNADGTIEEVETIEYTTHVFSVTVQNLIPYQSDAEQFEDAEPNDTPFESDEEFDD